LLIRQFRKRELTPNVSVIITVLCLGIPILMGFQNWDDHDRSKREGAYALAFNYLNDLDKNNPILFVYGDNDTYPRWGLQETDNFRDDVKVVNYTLLGSPWNIEQSLRKTYNAPPLPAQLEYKDYRLNTNDNIMVVAGNIRSIFEELHSIIKPDAGLSISEIMDLPPNEITGYLIDPGYDPVGIKKLYTSIQPLEKYLVQDSMTAKEALNFILDNKNPAKQALADYYGYPTGAVNYLPVDKIVIPVNKENALKYGIAAPADADKIVDQITIELGKRQLYKSELLMIAMFADYKWDRSIYFSGGGISDPGNIFWLSDYLENNGFSYKLVPIHTPFGKNGKIGRTNLNKMYESFGNFKWANYNRPDASFSNTDRNYTNTYRNISVRLAEDFIEASNKAKAKEVLDKAMQMIPDEPRYDYGLGTVRIAEVYRKLGETKLADQLSQTTRKRLDEKIRFYESLPNQLKYTVSNDLSDTRSDVSLMVYGEINYYLEKKDTIKALEIFKTEFEPVKKNLIADYRSYNKDGRMDVNEQNKIDGQFKYISELLGIADMIDTAYAEQQTNELYQILTEDK